MVDFDASLAADSARFAEVLAGLDPEARVPSCPDWSAGDLLWHLTGVQRFWAEIVGNRALDRVGAQEAGSAMQRPAEPDAATTLFRQVSADLQSALAGARDDERVWTWTTNDTVGWVRRRQALEALVHRVDAELAGGVPSVVDPMVAEAGVEELMTKFGAADPPWGNFVGSGRHVRVTAAESGRSWVVELGRFVGIDLDGAAVDEPDFSPVSEPIPAHVDEPERADGEVADITGPAADLLLWMWGRASSAGLLASDPGAVAGLRAAMDANTQ